MVEFSEAAFDVVNQIPPGAYEKFVTIQQCQDFVASTTRNNYIWMGMCVIAIIVMFVVLFKRGKFDKELKAIKGEGED